MALLVGMRKIVLIATVVISIAMIATAFAPNIYFVIIVLGGIGGDTFYNHVFVNNKRERIATLRLREEEYISETYRHHDMKLFNY